MISIATILTGLSFILIVTGMFINVFFKFLLILLVIAIWLFVHTLVVRIYYGIVKCGIRFFIQRGVTVYIYTNRRLLRRANYLCTLLALQRENRLSEVLLSH